MSARKATKKASRTAPSPTEPPTSDQNDKVGYCNPPKHTRFPPGKSGNPNGRPSGRANSKTTVARVINEKVPVREGDKTRKMSKLEAVVQSQVMKAMKGDAKSANVVIGLMARVGLLADQDDGQLAVQPEDDAIVKDYLRRMGYRRTGGDGNESEEQQ
jgi:hypothetical protein